MEYSEQIVGRHFAVHAVGFGNPDRLKRSLEFPENEEFCKILVSPAGGWLHSMPVYKISIGGQCNEFYVG